MLTILPQDFNWVNEVANRSVAVEGLRSDVVAGEVVVSWSVSVEGLPSGIGRGISAGTTVDDDRDQTEDSKLKTVYFITCVPPLGQRPWISSDGFPWVIGVAHPVIVGVGNYVPRHWLYSLGWKLPRRLNHWRYSFGLIFHVDQIPAWKFSLRVCCLSENCSHTSSNDVGSIPATVSSSSGLSKSTRSFYHQTAVLSRITNSLWQRICAI